MTLAKWIVTKWFWRVQFLACYAASPFKHTLAGGQFLIFAQRNFLYINVNAQV